MRRSKRRVLVALARCWWRCWLLGRPRRWSPSAIGATLTIGAVPVTALLAVEVAAVGAVGATGDRPRAGAGLGRVAFAVQLYHHPRAQHRVVLGPAHPLGQLPTRPCPDRELAVVERHEHRVKTRRGRPARALPGRLNRALPDGLGVTAGMPSPWRANALRSDGQVVPSSVAAAFTEPSRSARQAGRRARPRPGR
jgi:hypothetical protein